MPLLPRLRMMTYNVHRCIGQDRRLSPARIAAAIAEQQPDIVALQELDIGRRRTDYTHQVSLIAEALSMNWFFHPAYQDKDEHYGDALLSSLPMRLVRSAVLPAFPGLERRGALWIAVEWEGRTVHFLTTHLGYFPHEQLAQAEALLGSEWLAHPLCQSPRVLCGDLNAVPGSRAYRRLRSLLYDPFSWRSWPPGTYPSSCPLLRIDHVLLSAGWTVHRASVVRTRLTRIASDHLPLLVEASLS